MLYLIKRINIFLKFNKTVLEYEENNLKQSLNTCVNWDIITEIVFLHWNNKYRNIVCCDAKDERVG